MPTVKCCKCGAEFHAKPANIVSGSGKYCSRGCYSAVRGSESITAVCEQCGKEFRAMGSRLKLAGGGKFCSRECRHKSMTTHGEKHTRLYCIWKSMKSRCNGETDHGFERYGKRGISVCGPWSESFVVFRDWALSNGYSDNLSIDRIDNDGNYEPSNCRWADRSVQTRNQGKKRGCTSKYKGVHWNKNSKKWEARIKITGRKQSILGGFDEEESAARAYDKSCREFYPGIAVLNFPLAWIQEAIELYRPTCVI